MKIARELITPAAKDAAARDFDLAHWLGRREAFGLVAGRCSAAEVECLRRMRDEKLYLSHARNWDDFCSGHLGADRRTIDRHIDQLVEFGPAFFHLSQLTRITPEAYRAIAPHVSATGVTLGSEVIALVPENCRKLAEAVATLRHHVEAKPAAKALNFDAILKRCQSIAVWLEALTSRLDLEQQVQMDKVLRRVDAAARRVGVEFFHPERWEE